MLRDSVVLAQEHRLRLLRSWLSHVAWLLLTTASTGSWISAAR